MKHLTVLLKREWLEAGRSYKLLWLPVVFMLLGMLQPLVYYYMPQILQMMDGLPEGLELNLPAYSAEEAIASTLTGQFDQLGLLILVISMMGLIISDKNNGMLTFISTRNTTLTEYLLGKWIGQAALLAVAIAAGFMMSALYTSFLYHAVPIGRVIAGLAVYYVWCLFILTVTLTLGALLSRVSAVAVLSIMLLLAMRTVTGLGAGFQSYNPAFLSNHAVNLIVAGEVLPHFVLTAVLTFVLIALLLFVSKTYLSRKELPSM